MYFLIFLEIPHSSSSTYLGLHFKELDSLLRCDNSPLFQTSKSITVLQLLQAFILCCSECNALFKARPIMGTDNGIANALSQFQEEYLLDLVLGLDVARSPMPNE